MKIHRSLVEAVAWALSGIFLEAKHADKVIETLLKSNPKWGSRDRAFIASNTYEIVRWWRLLWAVLQSSTGKPDWEQDSTSGLSPGDFFRLVGVNLLLNDPSPAHAQLPDWPEFQALNPAALFHQKKALGHLRKYAQSIPDWMDELGTTELGEEAWGKELAALNRQAVVALRANSLKIDAKTLKNRLAASGFEASFSPLSPTALVLKQRVSVFQVSDFQKGFFEVQDEGSQCIAPFLRPEPGMRVIDACAGAGGKTLHLAALMENKGQLIALDTHAWKLEELRRRARRNGAHIVETRPITSTKVIKRMHGTADRLLLDVPCSGLGTLRRNPDAKWKLSPAFLTEVRETQAMILRDYSKMLRPGGLMVYATCSILPSENERQVERFLAENPDFQLLEQRRISPAEHGCDGFFMASLKKSDK